MLLPPASVLATWPVPNYDDPPTRGEAGKVVAVVLTFFVTLILAIRVYTRRVISKGFGLDDKLILIAYVPALAFALCGILAEVFLGWNKHVWDVRLDLLAPGRELSMATYSLFDLASNLTKLSIMAMLYRLISPATTRMRVCVYVLSFLIVCSGTAFVFIVIFQCNPISDFWTFSAGPQNCLDQSIHLLAAGSFNTLTDFVVVTLPIKTVAGLQLPRKQLFIVIGLFCAGFLVCIAGVARTYFTWVMTVNYDTTWDGWAVWVSSSVELYLGLICASVPSIRPFFTAYLPGLIDSSLRTGSTGDTNGKGSTKSNDDSTSADVSHTDRSSIELLFQHPRTLSELSQLTDRDRHVDTPTTAPCRQTWPAIRSNPPTDEEQSSAISDAPGRPNVQSSRLSNWPLPSAGSRIPE